MQLLKSYEEFARKQDAFRLRVERDPSVEPRKIGGSNYLSFYVRVSLDIDPARINSARSSSSSAPQYYTWEDVKLVKYELHPSYYDRTRIAESAANKFEVGVWTYGFYPMQAVVLLNFGQTIVVSGEMRFPVSEAEKAANRGEVGEAVGAK